VILGHQKWMPVRPENPNQLKFLTFSPAMITLKGWMLPLPFTSRDKVSDHAIPRLHSARIPLGLVPIPPLRADGTYRSAFPKLGVSITIMSASLRENEGYMMASSRSELEQRVTDLEAEVSNLKHKFDELATVQPWWKQIVGTFEDDPVYDEAMKLGRHYRRSLRPKVSTRRQK
jgi:hypothetical protein